MFGLVELKSARAAQRQEAELARLRRVVDATEGVASATDQPPAVARELIVVADRIADLTAEAATADVERPAAVLRWMDDRVRALLALCEVAPILDGGTVDFLRHEVVADRPTSRTALVDHIAGTVRPGYRWRNELLRPQQVVAYVAENPRA